MHGLITTFSRQTGRHRLSCSHNKSLGTTKTRERYILVILRLCTDCRVLYGGELSADNSADLYTHLQPGVQTMLLEWFFSQLKQSRQYPLEALLITRSPCSIFAMTIVSHDLRRYLRKACPPPTVAPGLGKTLSLSHSPSKHGRARRSKSHSAPQKA